MDDEEPLPKRKRLAVRIALLAGVVAVVGGIGTYVAVVPPTDSSILPKCLLHSLTGLHCPGCGLTRSLHALLTGRPLQALAYNALFPVFFPIVFVSVGRSLWQWAWDVPSAPRAPTWWRRNTKWFGLAFGVVILAFTVLRNVPAYPFSLLAPHEITAAE